MAIDGAANLLLTDLMSWTTLALCLIVILAIYSAIGRLAHHPHALFALGLLFMIGTYLMHRIALPGTSLPIDVSLATLGGNLVVVAFVMRAERAKRYWKRILEGQIKRKQDKLQALEAKAQMLDRDDPTLPIMIDRIADLDEELQDLRDQLQASDE